MAAEDHRATQRTQFRDIVVARKEALNLSYAKLAARCIHPDTGVQTVKDSWLHRVATGETVQAPDFDMLLGMAEGMEVDIDVLQDAASAQFFGSQKVFTESAEAKAFLEDADRLTPAQREAVQALMRSLAEGR
ncbi:hypothetical protein AB0I66_21325 [Streptomyces sp. NPDC050439]|uniref:hypothetical protein n=1 Tax=unclassified Streptomyces TaxID=2593676 RepID=UPI0034365BAB